MQRIGDHSRVQMFLTSHTLGLAMSVLSFVVFSIVLLVYNWLIFVVFMTGSIIYGLWITIFLRRRKVIDYELFEQQSKNKVRLTNS